MHVGDAGPYRIEVVGDLPLDREVQIQDEPPWHHLSWLPSNELAFGMQVMVGAAPDDDDMWDRIVEADLEETCENYHPERTEPIDGEMGPGIVFVGTRLHDLGRYEGPAMAETYVGEVGDDIITLFYRFKDDEVARADMWRRLFHSIAYSSFIARGEALARSGVVPPATRVRRRRQ